jgi:hypothetical protein
MRIKNALIDSFTVGQALLRFDTDPPELDGFRLDVLRGEGRGQDDDLSNSKKLGFTSTKEFLDRTIIDIGLLRQFRYWVEVHRMEGGADILERTEGPFYPGSLIPVLAIEIVRRLDIMLKHGGTNAALYTFQTTEKRCATCWDEIKQAPMSTHCEDCLGTGVQAGFSDPFIARVMMNPPRETNSPTVTGEVETIGNQMLMGPFPRLQPKDIVRTFNGTAWRVVNITPTEYKQALVQQFVTVSAIEKSNPVYKLPVPDQLRDYDPRVEPNRSVFKNVV